METLFDHEHPCVIILLCSIVLICTFIALSKKFRPPVPEKATGRWKGALPFIWPISAGLYVLAILLALYFIPAVKDSDIQLKTESVQLTHGPTTYVLHKMGGADGYQRRRLWSFLTLSLAPPIFSFYESTWIFGKRHGEDDNYKHAQDLAAKIWAAVIVLLGFYWFHIGG